jgi:hypothetical protein
MTKKILIALLLLFTHLQMGAQSVASDTAKVYIDYPKDLPTIVFDSARISPNGRYALVLKGDNLNGCWVNYWTLYQKGKNKPVEKYIVIRDKLAYLLDYEKGKLKDGLTITQNGETYSWDLSRKCSVEDLIKQYTLTIKPTNNTKKLKVVFDTLSPIPIKIPTEFSSASVGKTETHSAQRVEVKFYHRGKLLYTSPITYFADPNNMVASRGVFDDYLIAIKKQIESQPVGNDYGMLFLETPTHYFLSFKVESWIFSGWTYSRYVGDFIHESITSSSNSSPGADFTLLQPNKP